MQVTIQSIPASLQEFETLAAGGRQPERICALFLCALALFDKDRDAGTAAMNLLRGPRPMTPLRLRSSCATVCAAKPICRLRILKARRRKTAISRAHHTG
ncbi:MAG: DUF6935 domain-containing protein [Acutalibacteraceae bacterium]